MSLNLGWFPAISVMQKCFPLLMRKLSWGRMAICRKAIKAINLLILLGETNTSSTAIFSFVPGVLYCELYHYFIFLYAGINSCALFPTIFFSPLKSLTHGTKKFCLWFKTPIFLRSFSSPLQHFWLNYTNVAKTKQSKFVYWLFYTKTVNIFFFFFWYLKLVVLHHIYKKFWWMKHTEKMPFRRLIRKDHIKWYPKVMSSIAGVTSYIEPLVDNGVTRHFRKEFECVL